MISCLRSYSVLFFFSSSSPFWGKVGRFWCWRPLLISDLSYQLLVSFCQRMNDGMSAEGRKGHSHGKEGPCLHEYIPLKRNSPTLGGCVSVQMSSSKKATLNRLKGTSKRWWLFRGPVSFSAPSQTYKDYSCVHNTGCHTYTLWINWYYFHLVKGRDGPTSVLSSRSECFLPSTCSASRSHRDPAATPTAQDFAQIQSPFPLRRSLLPAGERPLLVETDRVDQSGRASTLDLLVSLHSFSGFCMYFVFFFGSYF